MTYLLYLLTFCLAVARPELGLIILTFALASVGSVWGYTSLAGFGSLQLSDFAILGLTVNLICHPRAWSKPKYLIWLFIVFWIIEIALIHGINRAEGLKLAYKLTIRYGLLWLIPIIVTELTLAKRRILLVGMLACGVFVTGIQAYTYIKRDPSFAAKIYYQFQNQPSHKRPEVDARYEFHHETFPRLYPRGALLVQSLMVFVLVTYMLSHRFSWANCLRVALLCLFGLFFLSLRQRSSAMGLALALCLFLKCRPAVGQRFRIALRITSIAVAGMITVLAYQSATGTRFVENYIERFQNTSIFEQHNRMNDNWLALRVILGAPLAGTGAFDIEDLALEEGGESLGLDVNPFLLVPVLGGLPLLFLVLAAGWQCGKRCRLVLSRAGANDQSIAAAISIVYMFCIAVLNFAGVFTLAKDMLPMFLFVGVMGSATQSYPHEAMHPRITSDDIRTRRIVTLVSPTEQQAGQRYERPGRLARPNRILAILIPH